MSTSLNSTDNFSVEYVNLFKLQSRSRDHCVHKHAAILCVRPAVALAVRKRQKTRKVAIIAMHCHLRPPDAIAFPISHLLGLQI